MNPKKLTAEQERAVIERRTAWRRGLLKNLAAEFGCSQSTIRRIEREWQRLNNKRSNRSSSECNRVDSAT